MQWVSCASMLYQNHCIGFSKIGKRSPSPWWFTEHILAPAPPPPLPPPPQTLNSKHPRIPHTTIDSSLRAGMQYSIHRSCGFDAEHPTLKLPNGGWAIRGWKCLEFRIFAISIVGSVSFKVYITFILIILKRWIVWVARLCVWYSR